MSDPLDELRNLMPDLERFGQDPAPDPAAPQNVTPLRRRKSPRAEEFRRAMRYAPDIEPAHDVPYLIKDWFAPGSLAVIAGPANVGKTFVAMDIVQALSKGRSWAGCKVKTAVPVLYVTLEGGAGFDRRVAALDAPCFWTLPISMSFFDPRRDPTYLAEAVQELAHETGPFGMIVIDTLARSILPGDENSAQDMGRVIASAELLKERTGACVLLIHHTGKDMAQGARGHSSLRAAVDTEIMVTKEEGSDVIEAKATKQRDMIAGRVFRYILRQVELWTDSDGDAVTTCVVERADEGQEPRRARVRGKQEICLQALNTALERHGIIRQGPDYPTCPSVTKAHWRDCAQLHGLFEGLSEDSAKRTFNRLIGELNDKALVRCFGEVWWPV